MACFDVVLQTRGSLHDCGDPTAFLSEYAGRLLCTRERDGKVFRVGKVRAYRLHVEQAQANGFSVFEVCDAHSQEMLDLYSDLFDPVGDELDPIIRDCFHCCASDILILDYVILAPRWRRLKLGLLAVRKMIDLLGAGCGLTVSHICPVHAESDECIGLPGDWVPEHHSAEERRDATRKLRRYFRRVGFRRIPGTRFHGLSMTHRQPTLGELIQPSK
jgi:hypothetical protein